MNGNLIGIICGGLVLMVLFLGGIWAIIAGIRNRKKAEDSNAWPNVDGVITTAWIEENRDTDEDGYTSTTYTPKWQYRYTLSGQNFTSERITFGATKGYGRRNKAQEELNRYPANSRVRVFFDPQNPAESTLVRGTKGTMGGIIAGVIMLLLGCCGTIAAVYYAFQNM